MEQFKFYKGLHKKEVQEKLSSSKNETIVFEDRLFDENDEFGIIREDTKNNTFICVSISSGEAFREISFKEITAPEFLKMDLRKPLKKDEIVLIRDRKDDNWTLSIFGEYSTEDTFGKFRCLIPYSNKNNYSGFRYCIRYAGNEILLGTIEDPEL